MQHNAQDPTQDFSYLLRMPFDIAEARKQFAEGEIDLLHIDGLHTYDAVSQDFNSWIDNVSAGGFVLMHDVTCRELGFGVWRLWEEIKKEYPSFLFDHGHGLGIIKKEALGSSIHLNGFELSPSSANEVKKRYAHAYRLMKAMVLLDGHQEKESNLEKKKQELLEKEKISEKHFADILFRNDLLERKIEDQFEERLVLAEAHNEVSKQLEKFLVTDSEKTTPNLDGQVKTISWLEPKQKLNLVFGTVFIEAVLILSEEENFESFFIRLGKRSIPCEIEYFFDKNKGSIARIQVSCSFTVGSGLKLCRLYGEVKSGKCLSLGWKLFYSISPPSRELLNCKQILSVRGNNSEYSKWLSYNEFSIKHRSFWESCKSNGDGSTDKLFSIIMPVFDPPLDFLREALASILEQTYSDWELCVVNDGGMNQDVHEYLSQISSADSRIIYSKLESNGGIAKATNAAIELSRGEYLVFVDHDDTIEPSALSEINAFVASNENIDFLYTDDDKIDLEGNRYSPQFKPDWSPELLLSYCYVSHMKIVRRTVSEEVGHVRTGYDGSQDYDYVLRVCEVCPKDIGHIPKDSLPLAGVSFVINCGKRTQQTEVLLMPASAAVQDCFDRRGIDALGIPTRMGGSRGRLGNL